MYRVYVCVGSWALTLWRSSMSALGFCARFCEHCIPLGLRPAPLLCPKKVCPDVALVYENRQIIPMVMTNNGCGVRFRISLSQWDLWALTVNCFHDGFFHPRLPRPNNLTIDCGGV